MITKILLQLFGLFFVLLYILSIVSIKNLKKTLSVSLESPSMVLVFFVIGVFTMFIGLATLVIHPTFESFGGTLVTIVGYIFTIKGMILIAFPAYGVKMAKDQFRRYSTLYIAYLLAALFGALLLYAGFGF